MTAAFARNADTLAALVGSVVHKGVGYARRTITAPHRADRANIAVLCDPFLRYGCAQAIGLKRLGLNVTLYYVDRLGEFAGNESDRTVYLDRAAASGVDVVSLPQRRIRSLLSHTLWLHRDLRRRRIAVAVVQWHIDPRYATVGFALPVALMVHDPQPHSGDSLSTFPLPVRLVARTAELTSACLVVHSDRLFDQIRPLLRRLPIAVVPHGAEMASGPAPMPAERRLLIFGRLFAYKGVDTALSAFKLLPPRMSDVTLVVAGRGPLAEIARGQHNVELIEGYVADHDIDVLLDGARLVLLPYKDATQSGVGLQAVARGVPCVVSAVGGLPELVQDSSEGLVVPPDSPEQLAEAIVGHIDDQSVLRTAIYDYAATHFAWPIVAHRLLSEMTRLGLFGRPPTPQPEVGMPLDEPDLG